MKKMLVGFIMDGKSGGLDKYLLNFLEAVQSEELQIDFLTNRIDLELKENLRKYHSELYEIDNLHHPFRQYRQVCRLIQENQYDVAYFNVSTAIDCVAAFAAKKCGVEKRVLHSHASGNDCANAVKRTVYNTIHKICRMFFYRAGTEFYGASGLAGEWAFPKKIVESEQFHVLISGVEKEKYKYNSQVRAEVREKLGLQDRFVIGHIGNFCYVKNYEFQLKIIGELLKKEPSSCLLLVGDGERYESVKEEVRKRGLDGAVKFLGWRTDTERLVQAMDIFLLPSHFEGLSIVSLEAQCAGLPCVLSDTVPQEVHITENCYFLSLRKSEQEWAKFILEHRECDREKTSFVPGSICFNLQEQKNDFRKIIETKGE